ncbi:hypothetical protein Dsin_030614 [Dipteronia sinensis]|uniref:Uncharacterized protein n=1 Tax=Dipteronia sinensis TaxID=43782 RepID=A0AAD9ZKD9_9ROSI|nr:hypothetical protein Dsin_030614 [Dipteronia sinensis]
MTKEIFFGKIILSTHLLTKVCPHILRKESLTYSSIRMERRLYEAALTGDVQKLHQLLGENPLTLHTVSLASSGNPLHVASAFGHIDFVKQMTRPRPDFAKELNEDGFSPMHMASANGYLQGCRLQGRENKTPLHLAVIKGRVDVISEILSACGECLEDVTVQRDTASLQCILLLRTTCLK